MKRTPDHTERRIIDEARRQFLKKGFEQTNMSDIARQLGISRPKLHYYFRTKDMLFQAVFDGLVAHIIPPVHATLASPLPLFDKIERIADIYFRVFSRYPQIPRFIVNETARDLPHLLDAIHRAGIDDLLQQARQLFDDEADRGTIRRVSLPLIFTTFYSAIVFTFLSEKLVTRIFFRNKEEFRQFQDQWKRNIRQQMEALLAPTPRP